MAATKRNGKIELLRFLFSVIIVLVHTDQFIVTKELSIFSRGSLAVEFFFIISGYLMALSISKKNKLGPPQYLGSETAQFIWHKIKTLNPNFIVAFIIAYIVMQFRSQHLLLVDWIKKLGSIVWEFLFIQQAGFNAARVNGADWYISAMLLSMIILYPLCRKYFNMFVNVIAPAIAIFLLGFMFKRNGTTFEPWDELGVAYNGLIRAFAEISLGAAAYSLIDKIKNTELTKLGRGLVTIVEFSCYTVSILYMQFGKSKKYDFFVILLLYIAIILSFSQKGACSKYFNNKFFVFLGKISLSIYLSHIFWAKMFATLFKGRNEIHLMLQYFALTIITTCIVYFVSELIVKIGLANKIKNLIVKEEK